MSHFGCRDVEAASPELALAVLPGDERAAAFAHLESCQTCRANVAELGTLVDEIVACGPTAEPPVGFEQRVLGRMIGTPPQVRRRRRRPLAVVGLAVAAAIVWLFAVLDGGPETRTAEAAMLTDAGAVVGEAVVSGDDDSAMLTVAVPAWAEQARQYDGVGRQYSVNVELDDGGSIVIPVDQTAAGRWDIPVTSGVDSVAAVAFVDETGHQWCSATFDRG